MKKNSRGTGGALGTPLKTNDGKVFEMDLFRLPYQKR